VFGVNGGESYATPHLDALAASGMRFTHCHSQPLCTPSRVQIMTGRYNNRNYREFGVLDPKERTFANELRDAGYATCVIGGSA
jgi:arylsulfatase A